MPLSSVLNFYLKNSNLKQNIFDLFSATGGGHTEIVKMLLESGADYMISTEAGLNGTALHYAAGKGKLECVRWSKFS